jgi:hypothetical protein
MQNAPATTAVHHREVDVAADWAAEAEALAQRVNSRLRQPTVSEAAVERDEYEPHASDKSSPSGRLTKR